MCFCFYTGFVKVQCLRDMECQFAHASQYLRLQEENANTGRRHTAAEVRLTLFLVPPLYMYEG